jgi:hypothetical protein
MMGHLWRSRWLFSCASRQNVGTGLDAPRKSIWIVGDRSKRRTVPKPLAICPILPAAFSCAAHKLLLLSFFFAGPVAERESSGTARAAGERRGPSATLAPSPHNTRQRLTRGNSFSLGPGHWRSPRFGQSGNRVSQNFQNCPAIVRRQVGKLFRLILPAEDVPQPLEHVLLGFAR